MRSITARNTHYVLFLSFSAAMAGACENSEGTYSSDTGVVEFDDVDDIPTPGDDVEDDAGAEESEEEVDTGTGAVEQDEPTVVYEFTDSDSLLYVQVWKDESAWGSGFAHDHVMRAADWTGSVTYDVDSPNACDAEFSVPVEDLVVDEDAMREYVGYGDTISSSDRDEIRENMLASDQLDSERYSTITLRATDCTSATGNSGTLTVSADMKLRGESTSMSIPLEYDLQGENLYISGEMNFTHADFGFEPYSALGGLVKNGEDLRITLDLVGYAQ
ncbi:MAG: YceI family protein [Myxococcota bacterium]|jgi:polyisoprenoid-binding protein YceI|nr:YceI family protein [Myxococcota bacterium]